LLNAAQLLGGDIGFGGESVNAEPLDGAFGENSFGKVSAEADVTAWVAAQLLPDTVVVSGNGACRHAAGLVDNCGCNVAAPIGK